MPWDANWLSAYADVGLVLGVLSGGLWALLGARKARRLEASRWLQLLFADFYKSERFDSIRIDLEHRYDATVGRLTQFQVTHYDHPVSSEDAKQLLTIDNFLNYFENLLYLEECKELDSVDVEAVFQYWFSAMREPDRGALRAYTGYGYERLARRLDAQPIRSIFVLNDDSIGGMLRSEGAAPHAACLLRMKAVGGMLALGGNTDSTDGQLFCFDAADDALRVALSQQDKRGAETLLVRRAVLAESKDGLDCWVFVKS